jgi:hypothetical protein
LPARPGRDRGADEHDERQQQDRHRAIFISNASTFLPRYSGVRPIISPATNTATIANISMP